MMVTNPPGSAQKSLKSLDVALAELLGFAAAVMDVERVSTFDADGRVLAQDIVSELRVPAQDNSAMDGYAVRRADVLQAQTSSGAVLPVSQRIAAGSVGTALAPMSVARIFTGAPVPDGLTHVALQENVTRAAGLITLGPDALIGGPNIRPAG